LRSRLLGELAPYLPESRRAEVLAEVLAAASTIDNALLRSRLLGELVPHQATLARSTIRLSR